MSGELWAGIVTSVVVPVLLRVLMHYMPWLADDPGLRDRSRLPSDDEVS